MHGRFVSVRLMGLSSGVCRETHDTHNFVQKDFSGLNFNSRNPNGVRG